MDAIILSIGDELVLGQTIDTNSAWLSAQLAAIGCRIKAHLTVPDDQPAIERAIREAALLSDVLIISGGLGPTEDDLTRQALAQVMNEPLELNEQWLAELENFFAQRTRKMPPANRIQAMIPRGAKMIFNAAGTAAGIWAVLGSEDVAGKENQHAVTRGHGDAGKGNQDAETRGHGDAEKENASLSASPRPPVSVSSSHLPASPRHRVPVSPPECHLFVMPGVPKEMKIMFQRDVLPFLRERSGGAAILSRTLHTFGLGESAVAEKLGDLMQRSRNPSVGTTVSNGIVSLRVNSRFGSREEAAGQLEQTVAACRSALGSLIYGQDEQTLQEVVAQLLRAAPNAPTVATAESCTGGLLGKMLTDIAGSSSFYGFGWVTYANQAKEQLLGVPAEMLKEHGAVSEPVVRAMAQGARERSGSTYALAISGIAGPDGGTPQKPVGTVWIGLAHPTATLARKFLFPGDREFIRDRSAKMALTLLRYLLLGEPAPF